MQGRNLAKFDHVKNDRHLMSAEDKAAQQADPSYSLKHMSEDTRRVMAKLNSADAAAVSVVLLKSVDRCLPVKQRRWDVLDLRLWCFKG